jgi:hypothetical protein
MAITPESIIQEVARREALTVLIDGLISSRVVMAKGCHSRMKRGQMHALVAEALRVKINWRIRRLVNDRMEAAGFPMTVLHGAKYFRNASLRDEQCEEAAS